MSFAPVILFTYCRPIHTRQTVESLLANIESFDTDLIIYSDAPKNELAIAGVQKTREYLRTISGFRTIQIIERSRNWGLANSIIDGVTSVINKYGRCIVVEDDLIASPYFLKYMNDALNLYESEERVISIHGYTYPVKEKLPETFFVKNADCWGWATWKRGWDLFNKNAIELLSTIETMKLCREFDFDSTYPYTDMLKAQIAGNVDSWAIRWYASAFVNNKLTLYPGRSLIFQNGMDGLGGTHCGKDKRYDVELSTTPILLDKIPVAEVPEIRKSLEDYFLSLLSVKAKIKRLVTNLFYSLGIW